MKLNLLMKRVAFEARKHAPTIMSLAAVGGLGATVYFSLVAKPRADEVMEERRKMLEVIERTKQEKEKEGEDPKEIKAYVKNETRDANLRAILEIGKACWKPVVVGGLTVTLIIGANHINLKRLASLGVAYEAATGDLKKYKEKALEVLGAEKEAEVREAIAKERVAETWTEDVAGNNPNIFETGLGNTLYQDAYSGRFFKCSKTAIEAAVNRVNHFLNCGEMYVTVNTWYDEIRLEPIGAGEDECVASADKGLMAFPTYTWTEAPNGEHCCMIEFDHYRRPVW